jgi:hypothetical protein
MIKAGTVITALEEKVNQAGVTRVRFNKGWLSVKSGDGTVLLKKQAADESEEESGSEYETDESGSEYETESEYDDNEYVTVQACKKRAGFLATSKDLGAVKAGTKIIALETKVNKQGITRVRFSGGWLSTHAGDGTKLLAKAGEDEDDDESEYETESGSEYETESEYTDASGSEYETESEYTDDGSEYETESENTDDGLQKYLIVSDCKLRAGFEGNSKDLGIVQAGGVITALETRVNEHGILRVQFDQGWLSVQSSDGTVLLEEYDDSEDESEYTDMTGETDETLETLETEESDDGEEVLRFLEGLKLEQFYEGFEEEGYDTMQLLKELDEDELEELMDEVEMKKGHQKKFVRALEKHELKPEDEDSLKALNAKLAASTNAQVSHTIHSAGVDNGDAGTNIRRNGSHALRK